MANSYPVLLRAREITGAPDLDILQVRRHLGVPLAADIRRWLGDQPPLRALFIDFREVRAVTASVAEELGPLLMQAVQQSPALEHRYPILGLDNPEHAYTFALAFASANWTGLATVAAPVEPAAAITVVAERDGTAIVVLGQLSRQMEQILRLADRHAQADQSLTSETLADLDFLADVSPAARSKRLTELYARRLLAFRENPRNPKERLFTPAWRLRDDEHRLAAR